MYIAMSRFEVVNGEEDQFEKSLEDSQAQLKNIRGYLGFHLIRGGTNGTVTFYSSHTKWANKKDFLSWSYSEQFRALNGGRFTREQVRIHKTVLWDKLKSCFKRGDIQSKV